MAKQHEFRLGPVGAVDGGRIACQGCRYDIPPECTPACPVCGWGRSPYPAGRVERFDWVFEQWIAVPVAEGKPPKTKGDPAAMLVLLALVSHDKPTGKGIFPSQERLARMTGLSRRAVVNALARLETGGWIEREKTRGRSGRQTANCSAPGSLDTSLSHAAGLIEIAACHA